MDQNRIAELLRPFLGAQALSSEQLALVSTYIELLLRWNTRVNLTAVRDPESIVSRHFGESLFLAAHLFSGSSPAAANNAAGGVPHALDLGSGAGFPGLPLKIFFPDLRLTLVESNRKKAAFLAEVIRALGMSGAQVSSGRLELAHRKDAQLVPPPGIEPPSLVTLRAVERFESAVRTAAALVRYGSAQRKGTLALLIGGAQASQVPKSIHDFTWDPAALVPQSAQRVLLVGRYSAGQEPGK
jgi:16S rRNA (guanine527-N7)-methyltransferase